MKISASIYANNSRDLKSLVNELDAHNIDLFHIDCNDDERVFEDIKTIRNISTTPIDLHLISSNPAKYYELIREQDIEYLTIQYENLPADFDFEQLGSTKQGLAILSDTDFDLFEKYKNRLHHILFMATTPGKSGGKFNVKNFNKIRDFSALYPKTKIFVDGGINEELSFILRNMGVYLTVVGSYLFKNKYLGASILNLKSDNINSHYKVKDIMQKKVLPTMQIDGNNLYDVLVAIENYNMGFVVMVDSSGKMAGIITNADVRRALIKSYPNIDVKINDIVNKNPVFINEEKTVTDLLKLIRSQMFPILYLPVTNSKKELTGVLMFNNLIRGES